MEEIDNRALLKNAASVGTFLMKKLKLLQGNSDKIADVRGMGLLIGIEFSAPIALSVKHKLFELGFLVGAIGQNTLRLAPPLIITKRQAAAFISALSCVLSEEK